MIQQVRRGLCLHARRGFSGHEEAPRALVEKVLYAKSVASASRETIERQENGDCDSHEDN